MPKVRHQETMVFDIADKIHLEPVPEPPALKPAVHPSARGASHGAGWKTVALSCLALLLLTTSGLAFYAFHRVSVLNEQLQESLTRMSDKVQRLESGIRFDSRRQQLLLGIRDEIIKANPRISLNEAYQFSEWLLKACEKYPSVDPLMFLSIGIVESGFNPTATSVASARGLYQIWPSTGRMLARALDWEYTDALLYDPQKNTEMAALYLDILFSAYNDPRMVLAEYNGGPINAGYLRAGSGQAAAETREYVDKVLDVHQRLKRTFEAGLHVQLDLMHLDGSREGKALPPLPPSLPSASASNAPPPTTVLQ